MILKSETHHFHRLDLMRQAGFIVTIYDAPAHNLEMFDGILFRLGGLRFLLQFFPAIPVFALQCFDMA